MPPHPDRRFRPQMTLRQIGVLVIFAALALSVARPTWQAAPDPWAFALLTAVELPYVLLFPVLLLVRRGPLKGWIVAFLCGVPLLAMFLCGVPLLAMCLFENYVAATGYLGWDTYFHGVPPPLLIVLAIIDGLLLIGLIYLSRWLIPRRCPNCRRPAMLIDPSVPRSLDFPGRRRARSCLACGSRFRRLRGGPWVDVDSLAPRIKTPTRRLKDDPR
ncbi:hypothetical protein P12x_004886 [Tundrisphaera lichenicola]|uniref:hypothetical protein n=1 Tax=Tundrisphaera lichenicola TaxID=2029860 RepID=UPI003EC0210D